MRIGITIEDDKGLESNVASHLGQCEYFLIVDVLNEKITKSEVVKNPVIHGGGGCRAVDEFLKYNVNVVISGGMGNNAINKFKVKGINVFGFSGKAKDAADNFFKNKLKEIERCKDAHH